ncbi:Bug family tripartite tricarboxylate transporter substrate binding protein [Variovorax paradoxus]|uniref:Bug family tripartite tricarboxylate transporter substrate binding protein n=1 Tax=Variovorax paradoxus TaxID=34073 RepID=UPI002861F70F|nr:tripartite tricarboxylate transporter substrate-binding protein [Variovorax paradoxus]MDR6452647.1 tripartite-type tricarboxylate transporter receptor subunit TctC [Variovorax paradoxus]
MYLDIARRRALLAALAFASCGTAAIAEPAWPARPITLIVPYGAGGNVDVMARWIGPELSARLGQPVVIENVSGAGGVIGTEKAVRAKPDGYTLLLSVESTVVIAKMVTPSTVRYDGLADLVPVTLLGSQPLALAGKPALQPKTAEALYAELKSAPGKFSYASSGVGTSLHLGGELLKQQGGVDMVHVPYRAGVQIVSDLSGNQLDLAVLPLSMVIQQARSGKLRVYGVMSDKASAAMPEALPLAGVPAWRGAEVSVWQGIFAPKGTPPRIVAQLHSALAQVLANPGVRKNFEDGGVTPLGAGPEEFADFLQGEAAKFSAIVAKGNIRAE